MPTTVNFDAIKVELRDAVGNTISAQNNGSSKQRVIKVRPGEKFSVCVDFGEVTGRAPGSYSVRISLSVSAKKREKGWQRQDWCLGDSFEGGLVRFRSFRLWNYSYDNQYWQEDLYVNDDVFIVDPKTLTTKPPTGKANTQAVFIFKNIGQAYDSDDDPPSTKRRRSTVTTFPAVPQGRQQRAAAEKANVILRDMKKYQEELGKQLGSNTKASHGEDEPLPQTPRKAQHSRAAGGQTSLPHSTHRGAVKDTKVTKDLANEHEGAPSNAKPPSSRQSHASHDVTQLARSRGSLKDQHGALRPPKLSETACSSEGTTERDASAEDDGSEAQSCVGNASAPAAIMQEPAAAVSEVNQSSKSSSSIPPTRRQAIQGNPKGGKRKRSEEAVTPNTATQDSATAVGSPNSPGDEEPKISSPRPHADSGTPSSEKAEEVDGVFVFSRIPQQSQLNPRSDAGDALVKREPLGGTPVKARTEPTDESTPVKQQGNLVGSGEEEDAAVGTAPQRAPEAPSNPAGTSPVAASRYPEVLSEGTESTLKPTIKSLKLRIEYIEAQMRLRAIRIRKSQEKVEDDERYAELDEEKHACEVKRGEMEEAQEAKDRREKELEMSK
ncbi:unnamed protein product [Zymoseptoria tritici ST99CH_3D1]|nr:unnamed protein product [Zymoseptoria tritici ST99CH_3D1]